jgi:hypothetical protein
MILTRYRREKMKSMKHKTLGVILFTLFIMGNFSCGQEDSVTYKPARVRVSGECVAVLVPPKAGIKNLRIKNSATGKIVFNSPELTRNRMIVLPGGDYEFSAAGIKNAAIKLGDDCKITSDGKTFTQSALKAPPAVAFYNGQTWNIGSPIREDAAYYLTILDLDSLDTPVPAYTMKVSGKGLNLDIPLAATRKNNRIISETTHAFKQGNYKVTVSVNGNSKQIPEFNFTVAPKPPFTLTVNNQWGGSPLQYATIQVFKTVAPISSSRMSQRDYDNFAYDNTAIAIGDSLFGNTGDKGQIVLPGIRDGERLVFAILGISGSDEVGLMTRTADERWKTIQLVWPKSTVPGKGEYREFIAEVEPGAIDRWERIRSTGNYRVSMYYHPGPPANIARNIVLNSGDFQKISTESSRFDGSRIICFFNLSHLCKATNINYLIRVESDTEGVFMMRNTAAEGAQPPILEYTGEN